MTQQVFYKDLGQMPYKEAWDCQENLMQQNLQVKAELREIEKKMQSLADSNEFVADIDLAPSTTHHLLFVEHPPVYTLGKSGDASHILINEQTRLQKGIEYYPTNRGGDITFHGPQQIVGYPILDLEKFETDIGKYLRNLEEVIILTLADYGLKGERSKGETGVWLDPGIRGKERKICAMGVRCSRWITMHGFALNVNTDLNYFNFIIPCGIQNKQVTSLQKELGREVDFEEAKDRVKKNFEKVFGVELVDN